MKKPVPFGKYLLLERVNVGGMAEVFKAKAFGVEGFERMVAVKRILPNIAEDAEFITMFIDEAKISVQLNHANIAQVFDLGRHGESYYIALEYISGRDLRAIFDRARTRGEPLPIPMASYVVMKMCEGLDYAHNKRDASGKDIQLVHRDVSPQNVLVSYDGEVKMIDFGIAKAANKASQTQAGIVKGKFGYMSPEQVQGFPIDRRSDVFAVGICLYELLTSERLFVGESDFSTIEKIRIAAITPPTKFNARIPAELERIVMRALAKDLDQRYQTAMDLHDDLQAFMYSSGSFFARKDLSAYMRRAFAEEIAKETARDEVYRKLDLEEVDVASVTESPKSTSGGRGVKSPNDPPGGAGAPPPKPAIPPPAAPVPTPSLAPPAPKAAAGSDLDWDDDELATRVYEKGDMDSNPPPAVKTPSLAPRASSPGALAAPPMPRTPSVQLAPPPAPRNVSLPPPATAKRPGAPSPFERAPVPPTPSTPPSSAPVMSLATEVPPRPGEKTAVVSEKTSFSASGALLGVGFALAAALLVVAWFFLRPKDPATLQFATDPPDVVVVFDGQAVQSSSSPFSIAVDPETPHLLEVNKVGFRTYSTQVLLRAGESRTLPTIVLQSNTPAVARDVEVAFASDPANADVVIVRGRDRVVLGRTPLTASVDVSGEAWTVEMTLDGYETWRGGLNVPEGHSTMALSATLRARTAAPAVSPTPANTAPVAVPAPPPTTTPTPAPAAAPSPTPMTEPTTTMAPAQAPEPPPPSGPGVLRVNSTPWSQVYVDGRLIGNTPQMNINLASGLHRLTLVNPDYNIRENQSVMIEPGQTVTRVVQLQIPSNSAPEPTPEPAPAP